MPVLYEQAVRSYDYRFLDAKEAVISGWLRSRTFLPNGEQRSFDHSKTAHSNITCLVLLARQDFRI